MSSPLLAPLSAVYQASVAARAELYRLGWLSAETAPVPVISIGNLVAGGTGKTPFTALSSRILQDAGCRPVIVSRGYRGRRREDPLVVSGGEGLLRGVTAAEAGDEPVMLAMRSPDIPVVVARRRAEGARLAVTRFAAGCIVLDDGFQHLGLRRDLDLVLLDAEHPLDNGRLLPSGMLREPPSALGRAGALVFTRQRGSDAGAGAGDAASVSNGGSAPSRALSGGETFDGWVRAGTPRFHATMEPTRILDAKEIGPGDSPDREPRTASWLAGKRVLAFAGIARPRRFAQDIGRLGGEVVAFLGYDDHHVYSRRDAAEILDQVKKLKPDLLITTEKDVARLEGSPEAAPLFGGGLLFLRVEPRLPEAEDRAFRDLLAGAARGERRTAPASP